MSEETSIPNFPEVKAVFTNALDSVKLALIEQARIAVAELSTASAEAGAEGIAILSKLTDVSVQMAEGKIGPDTAKLVIDNYTEALSLLGKAITNETQAQAYRRGKSLLETLKSVALSTLEMGLQAAVPGANRLLEGLLAKVAPPA